jgi:hypothetical protein
MEGQARAARELERATAGPSRPPPGSGGVTADQAGGGPSAGRPGSIECAVAGQARFMPHRLMPAPLACCTAAGRVLDLSPPGVMGVLNITPDSFSDGGQLLRDAAPAHRPRAAPCTNDAGREGAAIIDVGGESTRPGARGSRRAGGDRPRWLPVVEALRHASIAVVSVDTSKPAVMREAAALGAG